MPCDGLFVLRWFAYGDLSAPRTGARNMSEIKPNEFTTPVGRFLSEPRDTSRAKTSSEKTTTRPCHPRRNAPRTSRPRWRPSTIESVTAASMCLPRPMTGA
jgi:hypothetical protein